MEKVITWKIEKMIDKIRNDGWYYDMLNIEKMKILAIEYEFPELEVLLAEHPDEYLAFIRTGACRAWN